MLILLLVGCMTGRVQTLEASTAAMQTQLTEQQETITALEAQVAELEEFNRQLEQAASLMMQRTPRRPAQPIQYELDVRRIEGGVAVKRADFDKLMEKPETLMRSVRVLPHKDAAGEVDGFRMSGIRRASAAAAIGLKNGDILMALNGKPLTSPQKAMEAYGTLKATPKLTLSVMRRGQPETLLVVIED